MQKGFTVWFTGLSGAGKTTISEVVAQSEVKITLGSVIPHDAAGFGGGAKLIVPGVAGIATIAYTHRLFGARSRGAIEQDGTEPDIRDNAGQFGFDACATD